MRLRIEVILQGKNILFSDGRQIFSPAHASNNRFSIGRSGVFSISRRFSQAIDIFFAVVYLTSTMAGWENPH
jgi:hypothetical protein